LTPLYDVLSAWPIIGKGANQLAYRKAKLAMAMRGSRTRYRINDIVRRHFDGLARQLGLAANADALIGEMFAAIPGVIASVQKGLPKAFPAHVLDPILSGLEFSAKRLEPK
jgi:serine/threonine-protein kinase HipA